MTALTIAQARRRAAQHPWYGATIEGHLTDGQAVDAAIALTVDELARHGDTEVAFLIESTDDQLHKWAKGLIRFDRLAVS